jgi:hypothetical protein
MPTPRADLDLQYISQNMLAKMLEFSDAKVSVDFFFRRQANV